MKTKIVKGFKENFNLTKKQARNGLNKAKAKIGKAQHRLENYIARNPKRASVIAVGLGAAIGAAIMAYWLKWKPSVKMLKMTAARVAKKY